MFQPSLRAVPWALAAIAILLIEGSLIWTRLLGPEPEPVSSSPSNPGLRQWLAVPLTLLVMLNTATREAWVIAQYALAVWPLPEFRRRHDAFFFREEEAPATTTPAMTQAKVIIVVACAALWSLQMLAMLAWFFAELVVRGSDEGVGAVLSWVLPPMVGWLVVVVAVVSYCGLGAYILFRGGERVSLPCGELAGEGILRCNMLS
ncbi:hypothetical protein PG999_006038 [Apiospora kogelbergensis]|uniref:DUF4328 domain-containing protein n=1 Tax=Apiospora kogelbergensis TaxID=1337665 RepID=A0AAW0QV96_9PEZI